MFNYSLVQRGYKIWSDFAPTHLLLGDPFHNQGRGNILAAGYSLTPANPNKNQKITITNDLLITKMAFCYYTSYLRFLQLILQGSMSSYHSVLFQISTIYMDLNWRTNGKNNRWHGCSFRSSLLPQWQYYGQRGIVEYKPQLQKKDTEKDE